MNEGITTSGYLLFGAIGLVIMMIVWYFIIAAAVKSAIKDLDHWNQQYLKTNNRLLIISLVNQGMKSADIKNMIHMDEDKFWSELMIMDGSYPR